jgi:hypothetical protein
VLRLVARNTSLLTALASLLTACAADQGSSEVNNQAGSPMASSVAPPISTGVPNPVEPNFEGLACGAENPVPAQGRLLTRVQYDLTVRDLFGGLVTGDFAARFPEENQVLGFSTNAEFHRATSWLSEGHMTAAEAIAGQAITHLDQLLPCSTSAADSTCAGGFISDFGAKAFRRPLTPDEVAPFTTLYDAASAAGGFSSGIKLVIEAMLQSPQFLYRFDFDRSVPVTNSVPVNNSAATDPNLGSVSSYRVGGYEMASRLSYFLWNSMPDAELFDAAAQGNLASADQVRAQAKRMLSDPKANDGVLDFFREWLALRNFGSLVREYPDAQPAAFSQDWRGSLELFLQEMFWGRLPKTADASGSPPSSAPSDGSQPLANGTLSDLFQSHVAYVNPALAGLYGVSLPAGAAAQDFFPLALDVDKRAGLLTQPALMALIAHPDQTAPIQRGVFVRDQLLCQPAPPPPPTVNAVPPKPDPSLTTRQRFTQHSEDGTCSGCHALLDPLGLPFEDFDQLGRYRDQENGQELDLSGALNGVRDTTIEGDFDGPLELGARLAGSSQVQECIVTQWYRYGAGRVEQNEDLCSLAQVIANFKNSGGNFGELLVSLVASDAFRYRSEVPVAAAEMAASDTPSGDAQTSEVTQ